MRMSKFVLAGTFAAIASGCVTSKPVRLPNGAAGLAISCPGTAHDVSDCMNKAAELCGGPYAVVTQQGEVIPAGEAVIASGVHRTLVVQCATPR